MVESRAFRSIQPQRYRLDRFRTNRSEPTEKIQTGVFIKWMLLENVSRVERTGLPLKTAHHRDNRPQESNLEVF